MELHEVGTKERTNDAKLFFVVMIIKKCFFLDETPLHHCVKHSLVTAIRQLLIYGSDVNSVTTNTGLSPLHMALQTATLPKSVEVIQTLITYGHGIDLNQYDYHGESSEKTTDCIICIV